MSAFGTLRAQAANRRLPAVNLGFGNGNRMQPVMAREKFPALGIGFVPAREALDTRLVDDPARVARCGALLGAGQ
jgi:hypothetical protein